MDVSVQYVGPMREDFISPNNRGPLWRNCKKGGSNVGSLVVELGIALEDALVLLSTSTTPLGKEEEFEDLVNDRPQNNLGEHVEMLDSKNKHLSHLSVSREDKISNNASDGLRTSEPGNPASTSIVSLPAFSSMRGSREKRGLHVENLHVRWAPDVYDPTPTSQSHTVKSYSQHGPKMSKKSNRHKHKGKSPRSNAIDKKHRRKSS